MRKIFLNIRLFFYYLFRGLISADKMLGSSNIENSQPDSNIEQQQEQNNLYASLLKGELTQEVVDVRDTTYRISVESKNYKYSGGGNSIKLDKTTPYTHPYENSDGLSLILVQGNDEIISDIEFEFENKLPDEIVDIVTKQSINKAKQHRIRCERNFYPRFRIEQYATRVIVKYWDANHAIVDLYLPMYREQFNNVSKFVQSELKRIADGDTRSEVLFFDTLEFMTKDAWGVRDMKYFKFGDPEFQKCLTFDGHYVLRYKCRYIINGEDRLDDLLSEQQQKKYDEKSPRENAIIDFELLNAIQQRSELDVSDELSMMHNLKKTE